MDCTINDSESSKLIAPVSAGVRGGYGTSIANEQMQTNHSDRIKVDPSAQVHSWLMPFFVNIFLACASFSIVMPSLAPYLRQIGAPLSFLPWVVSAYSIGEMIGSATIGLFYEHATKTCQVEGRGPRISLLLCSCLGIIGSAMYAAAGWIEDDTIAQHCVFFGRFVQGTWTGGQQAVEQAYLSAAVHPSTKVEYTATLSTCAVLGFVMGPTIGAVFCQIDTTIYGLTFNANNAPGFFILFAVVVMFIQTLSFFDGKDDRTGEFIKENKSTAQKDIADISECSNTKRPFNTTGVAMSIFVFLVHYYSFAVQETITTPMVIKLYEWSPIEINILFASAGIISLITSFSVRYLSRHVQDQTLLILSIVIGLTGSLLLIDIPQFETVLPVWRFLTGFSLITMAFPVGRNVVLGVFGNILGPVNQGRWMGVIVAVSALPRALGPFLALEALEAVYWRTWLEFGLCSIFFLCAFIGTMKTLNTLVPYSDFVKSPASGESEISTSPMPSPVLVRRNSVRIRHLKLNSSKEVNIGCTGACLS